MAELIITELYSPGLCRHIQKKDRKDSEFNITQSSLLVVFNQILKCIHTCIHKYIYIYTWFSTFGKIVL